MKNFDNSLRLIDLASLVIAFLLTAGIITFPDVDTSFADLASMRIVPADFIIFAGLVLTVFIVLIQFGAYRSTLLPISQVEAFKIASALLFGSGVLIILREFSDLNMVTNKFQLIFWSAAVLTIILNRVLSRCVEKVLRPKGLNLTSVLIIGTNDRAMNLAKMINSRPELGYRIKGFVDDLWMKNEGFIKSGHKVVASIDELPQFFWNNQVDEAIVCLPLGTFYHDVARIVELCEDQGITVRMPTDVFNLKVAQSKVENFGKEAMITMASGSMFGWRLMLKRALDIIASAILLMLLSPILAITAIIIKQSSPGPIFFVQDRVGLNRRTFKMYKFRTMVIDAEKKLADLEKLNEASGPVFKIKDDPRIIPAGKILRKLSIDELPQLFNVLKGNMSLVGPRPLPIRDYQGFNEVWHCRRFSVKPGITCLWQIKGRSNITFGKWMELDIQYIDNWSLWLDVKILMGTIPAVIRGSGAT